jgi:uncharacterized ferritin-like protein (DUF455 family)
VGELTSTRGRSKLLHALANHELLALELMALVLLRFPDAPAGFRLGLAKTLQDEQRHLALYLDRLRSLGHELGEEPLSGYFWRAIADVTSPLDYVVRMSLTFEQANLDFARHYAARMRQAGDADTAAVLDRVYADEVAHVAHGVAWFRRWTEGQPGDDFARYAALLPQPLTPSRAKGPIFDVEGRRRAGLDDDFLARLRVFAASKGRPPVVHLFTPGFELELAGELRPTDPLPAPVRSLAADLAPTLAFLARRDDLVLVPRLPGAAWREGVHALGWELPELVEAPELRDAPAVLAGRPLGGVRPWGWSPRTRDALAGLGASSEAGAPAADAADADAPEATPREATWEAEAAAQAALARTLASKAWGAEVAGAVHTALARSPSRSGSGSDSDPPLGPAWLTVGTVCHDLAEARAAEATLLQRGASAVVFKAPWGSSGRGAVRVFEGRWEAGQEGWLRRTLARQGAVVVEPWWQRALDLAVQLQIAGDRVREVGVSRCFVDDAGRFEGCSVAHPLHGLASEVLRALHGDGLLALLRQAAELVGARLQAAGHRGPAGIDAFVFRDPQGALRLRPVVEVNPRLTMGRLALAMAERVAPGRPAVWRQLGAGQWGASPVAFAQRLAREHPPQLDPRGRLTVGAVCTNDPSQAKLGLGVLAVACAPWDPGRG